jgi:hypothetical protein
MRHGKIKIPQKEERTGPCQYRTKKSEASRPEHKAATLLRSATPSSPHRRSASTAPTHFSRSASAPRPILPASSSYRQGCSTGYRLPPTPSCTPDTYRCPRPPLKLRSLSLLRSSLSSHSSFTRSWLLVLSLSLTLSRTRSLSRGTSSLRRRYCSYPSRSLSLSREWWASRSWG